MPPLSCLRHVNFTISNADISLVAYDWVLRQRGRKKNGNVVIDSVAECIVFRVGFRSHILSLHGLNDGC